VHTRKVKGSISVHFLGATLPERAEHAERRRLLVWGPVTDHYSSYDCGKVIQFLFNFRDQTRILLTSTKDMALLLERLHMHPGHVSRFFNFNDDKASSEEGVVEAKKAAPKKTKSPVAPKTPAAKEAEAKAAEARQAKAKALAEAKAKKRKAASSISLDMPSPKAEA
jgi:hypothetical protein